MKKLLIAAAFVAAGATAVWAGAADDAIKGRQGCMKAHGAVMGVAVPMVKGEKPYDAAALKAAYDAEGAACAGMGGWMGPETAKGETVETWAKPEIWSDPEGYKAAGGAWYAAAQKLWGAADEASFKAAFGDFGAGCKGCHEKYRRPKE